MVNQSELSALLKQVPVSDLAAQFGVDESTVEAAVRQALPALVGGMAVNASDAEGAAKLSAAALKHSAPSDGPTLKAIDREDGEKIVGHVLGDKKGEVVEALSSNAPTPAVGSLIPALLPLLAPLVMQFLSGKLGGGAASQSTKSADAGVGGVLGDLLGGLVGGDSASGSKQQDGGIGDLLGGLLGGGKGGSQGGLGGLLGGLFGGK